MSDELELPPETHEAITALCAEGDRLAELKRFEEAIARYSEAWALVPEPQNDWEAATWIIAAIADAFFLRGDLDEARDALDYAMSCPGALGNPFLHLRRGQVLFDSGELDSAADELMRAYMGAGPEAFAREDGRYLAFLRTRAIL